MTGLTVAVGLAKGLVEHAAGRGVARAALAASAGLRLDDLEDQDGRLPLGRYQALMRAAKSMTNDPAFPLSFGAEVPMAAFSVVGLIFHTCETIVESVRQVNRYGQLIVETGVGAGPRFDFEERGGQTWLVDNRPHPNHFPELTEATFARFVGMTRLIWDRPLIQEMHVTHPAPAHREEYQRICGVPTSFGRESNALRVDRELLMQPLATQPRYAFGILIRHAEELLAELERSRGVRGRVERLLLPILHTGSTGVEDLARKMGISRQTLFRRLKAEGVTYERLLDELRRKMALHYLAGDNVSVHEAAYLVGFSDRAAFSRAFKRWTGTSPGSARRGGTVGAAAKD